MSEEPLQIGRKYALKHTTRSARCLVKEIVNRLDVNTLGTSLTETLELNDIGRISLRSTVPLCFDAYRRNRYTGGFILIDEATNATVAAGMICEPPKKLPAPAIEAEYVI
jgi:bifunctional enzyme CysN/CysC